MLGGVLRVRLFSGCHSRPHWLRAQWQRTWPQLCSCCRCLLPWFGFRLILG